MKTIKRFRTYEEMKAFESNPEAEVVVRERHLAFEKLIGILRSLVTRKGNSAKS